MTSHANPNFPHELADTLRAVVLGMDPSAVIEAILEAYCSESGEPELSPSNVLPGNHSVTRASRTQLAGLILAHRGFDGSAIDWNTDD